MQGVCVLDVFLCQANICPRSSDPFYNVTYYIKWGTTFWTDKYYKYLGTWKWTSLIIGTGTPSLKNVQNDIRR